MSVPNMLSNPGLALQGACFDLDDLQALIQDYETRIAEERTRREKAEAHLQGCLSKIGSLEGELAKVKNLVMGALVKVQGTAPAPSPVAASIGAPPVAGSPVAAAAKAPTPVAAPPVAASAFAAAPKPAPVTAATKPVTRAGQVPFSAPRAISPAATSSSARSPEPQTDHGQKPKRRIMRSRR